MSAYEKRIKNIFLSISVTHVDRNVDVVVVSGIDVYGVEAGAGTVDNL